MQASLWLSFIQAILGVFVNTSLPQSKRENALAYLGLLGTLIDAGHNVSEALTALTARVQSDDPITAEEWELLKARSDAAHKTIQEAE